MRDYGEIPGGKNILKPLLYPFYKFYPLKLWSKFRWWRKSKLPCSLPKLNDSKQWLTVIDRLGAPGDALITSIVIRSIKNYYPKLKINCITPHPELISLDPNIDSINGRETFYSFDSSYWELVKRKEIKENIVKHNLKKLGISNFEYKAKFYLSNEEIEWAERKLESLGFNKPILAICTKSKEAVKNWPEASWQELVGSVMSNFSVIQLGDESEPFFSNVTRFAGELSMRQSAAVLSFAQIFIGPDSLLMHIANGLNIPSLILFGGSRPAECFGYDQNTNLATKPDCSPCWIHQGYEECKNDLICMKELSTSFVLASLLKIQNN